MTTIERRPVPSSSSSRERDARHEVLPPELAVGLDDARIVVRIPGVQDRRPALVVALGDDFAFLHREQRALRHRVPVEHPLRISSDRRITALPSDRHVGPLEALLGVGRHHRRARRLPFGDSDDAADVERTHRELRARFADRLRGDDADSFTDVDARAASEVATVAGRRSSHCGFRRSAPSAPGCGQRRPCRSASATSSSR